MAPWMDVYESYEVWRIGLVVAPLEVENILYKKLIIISQKRNNINNILTFTY